MSGTFHLELETYSDIDLPDPPDYENGYKEGLVKRFGDGERTLSDPRTGERAASTFDLEYWDDRRIREELASLTTFWGTEAHTIKITSRANRAIKGPPYVAWVGPLVNAQPTRPSGFRLTFGDLVTEMFFGKPNQDLGSIPWRKIGDGMLNQLISISENLDKERPEPIIYGRNRRVPDIDSASQFGFCTVPDYLGIMDVNGDAYHVWLVAGHACADIPTIRVDTVEKIANEGTDWLVPHHPGHTAAFDGNPYNDFEAQNWPAQIRRYTLIFGAVTNMAAAPDAMTDPDACASGHKELTVAVDGIEPTGEGSGDVINDRILQYLDFLINYVAHRGPDSYMSGPRLTNPTYDVFGALVPKIDDASFDAASAIAALRLPDSGDPDIPAGYIGAWVIGATPTDRRNASFWVAGWDRSCGGTSGPTHLGRWRFVMLSPTVVIKDAAPLYTDANEILEGTFSPDVRWPALASSVPFRADWNPSTGVWKTTDVAVWQDTIDRYGVDIPSEPIEYPAAPGITASFHLARLEAIRSQFPPVYVQLETTVAEQDGSSLGYLDLGDYFRYRHFLSISRDKYEIRLAQVVAHQVQVGQRRVRVIGIDCDDLIYYDAPAITPDLPTPSPSAGAGPPAAGDAGPTADITCPIGAVSIAAGSTTASRQALIDGSPDGTAFCLEAGIHTAEGSNTPRTDQSFTGEFGAIIDGTGWSSSDPDDAIFKGIDNGVTGVTIRNLVLRIGPKFGVNAYSSAADWLVDHCEIHDFLSGVSVGTAGTVSNNFIHHNTGDPINVNPALRGGGIVLNSSEGAQIIGNEVSYNGPEQKCGWGTRTIFNRNLYIANNFYHHNVGNGIWIDTDGDGSIIEDNIVEDNGAAGIDIEQTVNVIVRNNTVRRQANGEGIYVTITKESTVTGNVCEYNLFGIGLFLDYASLYPASELFAWNQDLSDNTISGNIIRVLDGQHASALTAVGGDTTPYYTNARNNNWSENTYIVPNPASAYWVWNGNKTFAQWQAIPQDVSGTVST
jgi:parallel beta-helix repeat protein